MDSDDDVPQLLEVDDAPEPEAGPSRLAPSDPYARPRIPLTLLTGYLGAGKSTLLEYILTADHGYRIAVCMNDFGDTTDIEAKALTLSDPSTGEQSTSFLSLPNGCLCCSVKDLGIAAIEEMVVNQRDKVDWVMVELTGVADPGPIAKSFWENEEMGDLVLDGIVCVVDSKNFVRQLDSSESGQINEAQRQLAASDVILLNKVDLVSPSHLADVRSRVKSINPTLRIHETVRGQMPLREIFNLRAYSDTTAPELQFLKDSAGGDHSAGQTRVNGGDHDHDHDRDHELQGGADHAHSAHLNEISTVLIPLPRLSADQWTKLNSFLETVLWEGKIPPASEAVAIPRASVPDARKKMDILRCKGLLRLEDGREMVLQGVMDIFELKEVASKSVSVPEVLASGESTVELGGKVVFIGRGVEVLKPALEVYLGV